MENINNEEFQLLESRERLETLLGEVEAENSDLKEKLHILEERDAQHVAEKLKLREDLEKCESISLNLRNELQTCEQTIQSLPDGAEFEKSKCRIVDLEDELNLCKAHVKDLERRFSGLRVLYKSKESFCCTLQKQNTELERVNADLFSKVQLELSSPESVNTLRSHADQLQRANERLKEALREKNSEIDRTRREARAEAASLRDHIRGEVNRAEACERELASARSREQALRDRTREVTSRVLELETENRTLKALSNDAEALREREAAVSAVARQLRGATDEMNCLVKTAAILFEGGSPDASLLLGTRRFDADDSEEVDAASLACLRREIGEVRETVSSWYADHMASRVDCSVQ